MARCSCFVWSPSLLLSANLCALSALYSPVNQTQREVPCAPSPRITPSIKFFSGELRYEELRVEMAVTEKISAVRLFVNGLICVSSHVLVQVMKHCENKSVWYHAKQEQQLPGRRLQVELYFRDKWNLQTCYLRQGHCVFTCLSVSRITTKLQNWLLDVE